MSIKQKLFSSRICLIKKLKEVALLTTVLKTGFLNSLKKLSRRVLLCVKLKLVKF